MRAVPRIHQRMVVSQKKYKIKLITKYFKILNKGFWAFFEKATSNSRRTVFLNEEFMA
jgi:hypothetical protein